MCVVLSGSCSHVFCQVRGSKVGAQVAKWGNTGKVGKSAHSFARRTIQFCVHHKIHPLRGEYPVADVADTRLATGVDLLASCFVKHARDHSQLIRAAHLIEIKTGSSACWDTAQGNMKGILNGIPCSPHNMAMVQLSLTLALFKRYKPGVIVGACTVLHVTADRITPHVYDTSVLRNLGERVLKDVKKQMN